MYTFQLRILFFANNAFKTIPLVLGKMKSLYMLSFKSNQLETIDAQSLSESVGWLILTDNNFAEVPPSIGRLTKLRKLMLAGNQVAH
jgi:Leucine-rich repeat (LRR) protein